MTPVEQNDVTSLSNDQRATQHQNGPGESAQNTRYGLLSHGCSTQASKHVQRFSGVRNAQRSPGFAFQPQHGVPKYFNRESPSPSDQKDISSGGLLSKQCCEDSKSCCTYVAQDSFANTTQDFQMTVIRRHHSAGRSRLDCHRWEQHFLGDSHPSIKTVETSANAKVFCETYFNSLQMRTKSRDERREEFEAWLQGLKLTVTINESYRREWFMKETWYLRRSRKLKVRSRNMTLHGRNTTPGDFDILQVLGKGSFGTVCLVQDKLALSGWDESGSEMSFESRARSDQGMERAQKRIRRHYLFRNHHSTEQLKQKNKLPDHSIYAMKVIRKTAMIKNSQEGHVRAERDFLVASAKSRWVVDLITSFQDKANLYLVMEYMVGGDFLSLLIKHDTLSEKRAKWYIAEMILCVEAVHALGWIHRDVKPDNFLISSSGHLKIADFGLAFDGHWSHDQMYYHSQRYSVLQKLNIPVIGDEYDAKIIKATLESCDGDIEPYLTQREREATLRHDPDSGNIFGYDSILQWRDGSGRRSFARSLVGTSQYMAPEIIEGSEYDGRCDWWSVGIILFECLFGHAPFNSKDRDMTKNMIVSHETCLKVPPQSRSRKYQEISKAAVSLLKSLLTTRHDRLSSSQYHRNDIVMSQNQSRHHSSLSNQFSAFVYPDDAHDIKKHPFFSNIKWHRLHSEKPPFVPSVRTKADTKYFDPEGLSSGCELNDDTSSMTDNKNSKLRSGRLDGAGIDLKVRARDRILRDEVYRKDAMKLRKQHAFLGYTYRRPPSARPSISLIA